MCNTRLGWSHIRPHPWGLPNRDGFSSQSSLSLLGCIPWSCLFCSELRPASGNTVICTISICQVHQKTRWFCPSWLGHQGAVAPDLHYIRCCRFAKEPSWNGDRFCFDWCKSNWQVCIHHPRVQFWTVCCLGYQVSLIGSLSSMTCPSLVGPQFLRAHRLPIASALLFPMLAKHTVVECIPIKTCTPNRYPTSIDSDTAHEAVHRWPRWHEQLGCRSGSSHGWECGALS